MGHRPVSVTVRKEFLGDRDHGPRAQEEAHRHDGVVRAGLARTLEIEVEPGVAVARVGARSKEGIDPSRNDGVVQATRIARGSLDPAAVGSPPASGAGVNSAAGRAGLPR